METRSIGPYPLSQDGTLTASPSFITHGRLKTEITHNVSIFLHVLNVFYRPYYDIEYEQDYRVTPSTPVVPAGITVHPGEPRELRVSLSVKY
jgi:hypothetical protein